MQFGPVSAEGGERRLNVLFTRARVRCDVFVSFNSGDIDLARTTKQGARVLKRYLQFAETGRLDVAAPTGGESESAFEEAVARTISELGFSADAQVGSAGFKIDLAVKHPTKPGSYVLAVECDGATYHSARWARERDRLRQELLENLGWSFHRIWSTDWFHQPAKERQKLYEAMALAVARH
jgi:very-short-patch-repair endonuclease